MAHIASCIANMEPGSTHKPGSPAPSLLSTTPPNAPSEKPFTWRMLQPDGQRKYQLFPKRRQSPAINDNTSVDPERAFAIAMGHSGEKTEKHSAAAGLRIKVSPHNLIRRRKVSVPELGPMTTVQEVAMDSPTIPGRPALHERSISAPEDGRKQGEPKQSYDVLNNKEIDAVSLAIERAYPILTSPSLGPLSPKYLTPLIIPDTTPRMPPSEQKRPSPFPSLKSELTPPTDTSRSSRFEGSPMSRSRFTPTASTPDLSAYPKSASTDAMSATTLPTPVSAPIMESRSVPKAWEGSLQAPLSANQAEERRTAHIHRRGASESSSMTDRGRPRGRSDPRKNCPLPTPKSPERRAFEELPKGWKPSDAASKMNINDATTLRKQALGQAERFEVLRLEDVEALSKELRQLDERTEYLRRTYNSLRSGRRNLHSRICQYLRSPRVARFSHESMLKQEEALAELDASIDDWVMKLERAENRRTRVRQKLLEHVAAAAILSIAGASDSLQQILPCGPLDISTPPRSPSKCSFSERSGSNSPSPQRVVAQVPSTILELPLVEEAEAEIYNGMPARKSALKRSDVESIRIYAGDELYSLLTDVEEEIFKMSCHAAETLPKEQPAQSQTRHERQQSNERLNYQTDLSTITTTTFISPKNTTASTTSNAGLTFLHPDSPIAPTPPMKDSPRESEILLTSAVFKP